MILYSWFQGAVFALAPVGLQWVHHDYWEGVCAIDWFYQKQEAVYYVITAFILCFAIPGVIMTFCYIRISISARKSARLVIPSNVNTYLDQTSQGRNKENKPKMKAMAKSAKIIKSLMVVVVLFFICLTPFCITKLLKVVSTSNDVVPPYANLFASLFGYLSSVVNPLIYGIFRSDFRKAYRKYFLKKISCNKLGNETYTTSFYNDNIEMNSTVNRSSHVAKKNVNPPSVSAIH